MAPARDKRFLEETYRKKYWVKELFDNRCQVGEYHTLVKEMREYDHESFYKYFRKTP